MIVRFEPRCNRATAQNFQRERVPVGEQAGEQLLLVSRQGLAVSDAGPRQRERAAHAEDPAVLMDAQMSFHRETQHRGGEAFVVVVHSQQIAHGCRRLPLGRFVLGDGDAPWRAPRTGRPARR